MQMISVVWCNELRVLHNSCAKRFLPLKHNGPRYKVYKSPDLTAHSAHNQRCEHLHANMKMSPTSSIHPAWAGRDTSRHAGNILCKVCPEDKNANYFCLRETRLQPAALLVWMFSRWTWGEHFFLKKTHRQTDRQTEQTWRRPEVRYDNDNNSSELLWAFPQCTGGPITTRRQPVTLCLWREEVCRSKRTSPLSFLKH